MPMGGFVRRAGVLAIGLVGACSALLPDVGSQREPGGEGSPSSSAAPTSPSPTGSPATDAGRDALAEATAGDAGSDADAAATMWTVTVDGDNERFQPKSLTIRAGDTVRFVWKGSGGHGLVSGPCNSPDGKFCAPSDTNCNNAPNLTSPNTYSHTFTSPGTYPFYCKPHCDDGMTGTIVVQ